MGHKRSSKKSLIKVKKNSTYKEDCAKGYHKPSGRFTQIHHIVCVSSMSNATIADKMQDAGKTEFIRECHKLTNWDINDDANTVGLPLKRAFVDKKAPSGWDGWPCHQVEHPSYTEKVSDRLYTQVWKDVLGNRTRCTTCATECNINAKTVEAQLKLESKHWLTFLTKRGAGTANSWKNRRVIPTWYIPFSMNPSGATPRKAPPDWDDTIQTLRKYCSEVMFSLR